MLDQLSKRETAKFFFAPLTASSASRQWLALRPPSGRHKSLPARTRPTHPVRPTSPPCPAAKPRVRTASSDAPAPLRPHAGRKPSGPVSGLRMSSAAASVSVQLGLERLRLQPRDGCSGPAKEGRRQIGKQADRTAPFWVDLPAFRQLQALSECPAVVTFEQGHQSLPDRVYTVLARLAEHQPTVMFVRVDCSTAPSERFDSRTANELCTRNRSAAVPRRTYPCVLVERVEYDTYVLRGVRCMSSVHCSPS